MPQPVLQQGVTNSEFLRHLAAGAPNGTVLWVSAFVGNPNLAEGRDWAGAPYNAATMSATVDAWGLQNTYFSVGCVRYDEAGEIKRRKTNFARLLALVADDMRPEDMQGHPTWVLQTSPGKHQIGLMLDGNDPDCADAILCTRLVTTMAEKGMLKVDPSGNNVVRYVRLPVGQNQKPREAGAWSHVLETWNPNARYTLADAASVLGIDLEPLRAEAAKPANEVRTSSQDEQIAGLSANIIRGEYLHDSINSIAASMVASGMPGGAVVNMLRGLMSASAAPRDERWQSRYNDIPRAVSTAQAKFAPVVDLSAFRAVKHATEPTPDNAGAQEQPAPQQQPIPHDLMALPGAMGECMAWMLRTANRPQPVLALGATLSLFATALSTKVCSPTRLRTNLYLVGVAGTSSGKDHGRKCLAQALQAAKLDQLIGGDEIASGQGLLARAHKCPRTVFQIDEFGLMLQAIRSRNAGPHLAGIVKNLMMLFGSTDSIYRGTEYADQKLRERKDIEYPCVNLHATTTPEQFFPALGSNDVTSGALNRMLILMAPEGIVPRQDPEPEPPPESLVAWIEAVQRLAIGMQGLVPSNPITMPQDAAAKALFREFGLWIDSYVEESKDANVAALWGRAWENAVKLSMLHRMASIEPEYMQQAVESGAAVVGQDSAAWGIELTRTLVSAMQRELSARVGDSEFEVLVKDVIRVIRKAGRWGLTVSELGRKCAAYKSREPRIQDMVHVAMVRQEECAQVNFPPPSGRGQPRLAWVASEFIAVNCCNDNEAPSGGDQ